MTENLSPKLLHDLETYYYQVALMWEEGVPFEEVTSRLNISYEQLKDLDEINPEFEDCDVAIVLGANDVVNPAARSDKSSPIYGMPILNVDKARTVIINKRTMNTGFAGVQNELFGYENSIMVFGDAKDMLIQLLSDLKDLD